MYRKKGSERINFQPPEAGFAFILLIILLLRLWEGDVLVQCGFGGRPYVDFKCICGGPEGWARRVLAIRKFSVVTAAMVAPPHQHQHHQQHQHHHRHHRRRHHHHHHF